MEPKPWTAASNVVACPCRPEEGGREGGREDGGGDEMRGGSFFLFRRYAKKEG